MSYELPEKKYNPLKQPFDPQERMSRAETQELMGLKLHSQLNHSYASSTQLVQPQCSTQLRTKSILPKEFAAELEGIYKKLAESEGECMKEQAKVGSELTHKACRELVALHQILIQNHCDLFLALTHRVAPPQILKIATKHSIPGRMWRHGIHWLVEFLRARLPFSIDHMTNFVLFAYSMIALLYDTTPSYRGVWIECLGDLARYKMVIEYIDRGDYHIWKGVARSWYHTYSNIAPTTGRIYHHLAVLSPPNSLQGLFYYSKSLCVERPYLTARESIHTLSGVGSKTSLETCFVKAHGLLFTQSNMDLFDSTVDRFLNFLDKSFNDEVQGCYIAVVNSVAMLEFGSTANVLIEAIAEDQTEAKIKFPSIHEVSMTNFKQAKRIFNRTLSVVLRKNKDTDMLPFVHVTLTYMLYLSTSAAAMRIVEDDFPWDLLLVILNTLLRTYQSPARIENNDFPLSEDEQPHLPEDYAMRGFLWTKNYFPKDYFNEKDEFTQGALMTEQRKERILYLACMIAKRYEKIIYSREGFSIADNRE